MHRPPLEVADIFRIYGSQYRQEHRCSKQQLTVMHAIEICRTAKLGGHIDQCDHLMDSSGSQATRVRLLEP